jgi:hypothetical protein
MYMYVHHPEEVFACFTSGGDVVRARRFAGFEKRNDAALPPDLLTYVFHHLSYRLTSRTS